MTTGDVGFRADCSEVELILMDKSEAPLALNSLEMNLSVGQLRQNLDWTGRQRPTGHRSGEQYKDKLRCVYVQITTSG